VSDVNVGLQSISFHVSQIGVPVLVKISYFRAGTPRARRTVSREPEPDGRDPDLKNVSMNYGSTPRLTLGNIIQRT